MFKVKFGPKVPININIHIVIACVHNSGQIVYRKSYYTLSLRREKHPRKSGGRGEDGNYLVLGNFDLFVGHFGLHVSPIVAHPFIRP